jgi:peptidoglycan/xylan/chitin deacetylase (PgdA/CDA1 family)
MIIKNFLFHRVSDQKDALWPPMQVNLFRRVIRHLKKNYEVINLEEYLQDAAAYSEKSKRFATVLFDDGYKDNIEFAAPILKELDCPASFYVVTGCINRNIPTWTYIIDHALQHTQKKRLELSFDYVPEHLRSVNPGSINSSLKSLKPWMKTLPNGRRKEIMDVIVKTCSDIVIPGNLMMNWNEIRQLQSAGFVIGSHSHTHPMLGRLENENEIEEELVTSFRNIEKELNIKPLIISYPIGSYDDRVKRLAQKSGYRWGLAVRQKFFNTSIMNGFGIPRVELYQEPWWKVRARTNGIYNRLKQLWQKARS